MPHTRIANGSFLPFCELDYLVEDLLISQRTSARSSSSWQPRMDLREDIARNTLIATIELAGLRPDQVMLDVCGCRMTISGEVPRVRAPCPALCERNYGRFSCELVVPAGIMEEDLRVVMECGLLTIEFPASVSTPPSDRPPPLTLDRQHSLVLAPQ